MSKKTLVPEIWVKKGQNGAGGSQKFKKKSFFFCFFLRIESFGTRKSKKNFFEIFTLVPHHIPETFQKCNIFDFIEIDFFDFEMYYLDFVRLYVCLYGLACMRMCSSVFIIIMIE